VSLYLDASVLVALFVIDPASARAAGFLASHPAIILVSDFGAAEFSSAVARRVRMRDLTREDALLAFEHFDAWTTRAAGRREITTADIGAADQTLRRLDVNLRTPDALHIAIAQRLDATLVTFDRGMAAAARALGMAVATP
jgi:predicted nucleic acid-binding protein